MKKYALAAALMMSTLLTGIAAGWMARVLWPANARGAYRTLEPDVYYPTFFKRYAAERAQRAVCLRNPIEVALAYVGETRVCPQQAIQVVDADAAHSRLIITRTCPYSVAPVKQFRIDLLQRDGFWEIEWAGIRYKCAVNQSAVGAYLLANNPFQNARTHWLQMLNTSTRRVANSLKPWAFECPPH